MTVNTHPSITPQLWKEVTQAAKTFNDSQSAMEIGRHSGYRTSLDASKGTRVTPVIKIRCEDLDYHRTAFIDTVVDLYQEIDADYQIGTELIWLNDGIGIWVRFSAQDAKMHEGAMCVPSAEVEVRMNTLLLVEASTQIALPQGGITLPKEVIDLLEREVTLAEMENF